MSDNHIILIGNYTLDHQESMNRYLLSLNEALVQREIQVTVWKPIIFFATGQHSTIHGFGKWLGYLDKWVLFPIIVKLRMLKSVYRKQDTYFHICDHSNSPYLAVLPKSRSGITCHDVLAIRGAFGYEDAHCPASKTGIYLQKWIFRSLVKAKKIACVSQLTLNQLKDLAGARAISSDKKWKVVYNSFNAHFRPMRAPERIAMIQKYGLEDLNYILHVGSALPRKNRKMLMEMVAHLDEWKGKICYAGQPIDPALQIRINELGMADRVVSVVKPPHEELTALYSGCTAFIFPSFSEGFGWPVIEAQACGAPVIASNIEPMPEVSGGAAIHVSPYHAKEFALALSAVLHDPQVKDEYIQKGFENCRRFDQEIFINQFLALYDLKND
ncbi:Glycosyltransferase involved in cell wall bisynthesis [Parapedobacter luteus]|uniref:Glycosyltransferase involved in cell wall bisynthesis n=1 Tax=Parapedobacter luteus TaxID=623280 RepID=A0A1T5FQQ9_9SPHI|nr:glycosyltransferase family 1 protein [Parapedobacter luteus]SKB98454.1 Glycosyltransferase involved in cell wall bisynthesis [Parapedobacter luteus]